MAVEDFDIDSLAAYLHLTPEQVRKMADRSRLPGRRVAGKWRFSRPEIHQWFEEKIGLSDDQELTAVEKVLDRNTQLKPDDVFHIPDLLAEENIYVPFLARTKSSVIQKICDLTAKTGRLWEPAKMADALQSREELHPTALGNGVALLHPRRPMPNIMGDPFLALGITTSGIPFGGPRGCLTDVFFLIGSDSESVHLKVLARLSRILQQAEFLERIRDAESAAAVWEIIQETDEGID
ncbi:MAG: PTS system nitrogen regulatory IIA component [Mariniblastus sp.]|jgi:PTS system nitrogen regulatory IIA component